MEKLIAFGILIGFGYLCWIELCEWWNGKKGEWRVKNYEQGNYYDTFEYTKQTLMQEANSEYYHKLGYMYYFGHGVSKSKDKAKEYFAKYYDKVVCEKIISYFERIENDDDANAYYNLGWHYAKGRGVMQDYQKALYYYQKAADLGNSGAYNNLGVMYANGKGVAKSYSTARSYFQKAADMGNKIACNNVAEYYEDGTGGTKDKYQTLKYYKKACDLGNKDGCANYQRLKNEMGITNDDAVLF